tara:strand:+ start:306 stop:755 length:450 start_codon:yes stop_codon:yes gene_type:complete
MPTKQDLSKFVLSWTNGLSMIRTAYEKNENYKETALEFINKHYLFSEESVLFKPTLTNKTLFRNSVDDALSYFIGGKYSEDSGFALKAYVSVTINETNTIIEKNLIAIMGILDFEMMSPAEHMRVAFTFVLKTTESGLKIKIHHSSLIV